MPQMTPIGFTTAPITKLAKNNIPVIFYFSGVHEDYHRPGDDPEKIHYDKTAEIGQLVFYTAWQLANQTNAS